ncbi:hypothetical protein EZV62_002065 [Acer yangbiense]|uniref:hAT-like transposase RNase-H fold domain-containing protein n=1 Tax=Acer yangbiense TaxID=1000413 RepID=A0A5C7IYF2_9ROSI|nr:hypothetical protein EZV62_002065 [Acer yangbiense]
MAATKNTKIVNTNEEPKEPKNLFTLLTTTLGLNQNQESKTEVAGISEEENEISGSKKQGDVVKFSDPKPITPPPLKLQVEEYENPAARLLYWDVIHGIMVVAAILDPRYKMKLIEYYFPIIYGDGAYTKIEKIQKICDDLVGQYRLTSKLSEEGHHFPTNPSSFQAREVRLGKVNHMANFDAFVSNAICL